MRNRILAAICLTLAAYGAPTTGAVEPLAWRFAHAEAQILAGVDFRRLAQSPDGAQIRAQFAAALGGQLLDQTERLLLSSVFDSGGKRADVLILSGTFSLTQLRKLAMQEGAKMVSYKGLEIAAPGGATAGDPHLAWVTGHGGGTTVLIGTRPAIQAAADRSRAQVTALGQVNPLFARGLDLSPQFPIWVTCDTLPAGLGPKSLDAYVEGDPKADKGPVEGFDIGIRAGADGEANFWVWAADEDAAGEVLGQLQAGARSKDQFLLRSWLGQLRSTVEGSTLALGAALPAGSAAAKVGPLLAAFALPVDVKTPATPANLEIRAKVTGQPPAAAMPVPGAPAEAPGPPKKLVVRIQGLDGGIKDIPFPGKP